MLVGSAFPLLGIMNPPDAWTLGMVEGLIRVAFLLLGVGALLLGVAVLLDRWPLVGVPSLLFGIAALPGGIAALLDDGPWWGRFYSARSQPCCWGSLSCWIDRH